MCIRDRLMAYRAIGMHESAGLKKRTTERLLSRALSLNEGRVVAEEGVWRDGDSGDPSSVPQLVVGLTLRAFKGEGDRGLQAHPDSVAVIRLPPPKAIRGWGLEAQDEQIVQFIEKARNRETTLDQLVRVASEGRSETRPRVRALMHLLWRIGFLDFRGRPWDKETNDKLDKLISDVHRARRGNLFEVLGLDLNACLLYTSDAADE